MSIAARAVQNSLYSAAVCLIVSKGNYSTAAQSAFLALIATVAYAALAHLNLMEPPESFFTTLGITYLLCEKTGLQMSILTLAATLIPFALQNSNPQIPFFGIIIC